MAAAKSGVDCKACEAGELITRDGGTGGTGRVIDIKV